MKICREMLEGTQIVHDDGFVVQCCSILDGVIGRLSENTMEEIWNSDRARYFFDKLANGDYSSCDKRGCPYLASGKMENIPLVEVDEIPPMPTHLSLSYERTCNYHCTWCFNPDNATTPEREASKDRIEKNLESVLPHLKYISANGRGEVFTNKRILRQLANWRPLLPKDEISVRLETNGSLFNEKNWRQIENLGQYNLEVDVTVMSFDEHVYQVLSGVKFPISRIESNLRFMKGLREQGIINHLEIATVVQDRNFREMPAFTKRCIEEFGADTVRLRPIIANVATLEGWITDVRGKYHPYHQEYLEVMSDPIFKHPKVVDWGAWNDSETGDLPQNIMLQNERAINNISMNVLSQMVLDESIFNEIAHFIKVCGNEAIIYGANHIGLTLALKLARQCGVKYVLDLNQRGTIDDITITGIDDVPPPLRNVPIIFTDFREPPNLAGYLRSRGYNGAFVGVNKFFQLPASS